MSVVSQWISACARVAGGKAGFAWLLAVVVGAAGAISPKANSSGGSPGTGNWMAAAVTRALGSSVSVTLVCASCGDQLGYGI